LEWWINLFNATFIVVANREICGEMQDEERERRDTHSQTAIRKGTQPSSFFRSSLRGDLRHFGETAAFAHRHVVPNVRRHYILTHTTFRTVPFT
jgi:hypothetical protein